MGLSEILFGADGVGGQPGVAGKALDFAMGTDIDVNAPAPTTGQGQLAKYGKDLARLPLTLAKLPLDFISDPSTFLRGSGGGADFAAIFSPTYRKEKVAARKRDEKFEELRQTFEGIKMFDDFTAGMSATPFDQRAAVAQQAEQAGLPSEQIDTALGAANQVDQQRASVIAAIRAEDPTIPDEVLANLDPDKGLAILTRIRESQAIQARADASAARSEEAVARAEEAARRAQVGFENRDPRSFAERQADAKAEKEAAEAKARAAKRAKAQATSLKEARARAQAEANESTSAYERAQRREAERQIAAQKDIVPGSAADANPKNKDWIPFNSGDPIPKVTPAQIDAAVDEKVSAFRKRVNAAVDKEYPLTSRRNIAARREGKKKVSAVAAGVGEAVKEVAKEVQPTTRPAPPPDRPREEVTIQNAVNAINVLRANGVTDKRAIAARLSGDYTRAEIIEAGELADGGQ